jgi:hypothetical protein
VIAEWTVLRQIRIQRPMAEGQDLRKSVANSRTQRDFTDVIPVPEEISAMFQISERSGLAFRRKVDIQIHDEVFST